jgi:hypothetical protein
MTFENERVHITDSGLVVKDAIEKGGINDIELYDSDLLVELIQAVRSQYEFPDWKPSHKNKYPEGSWGICDALVNLEKYRMQGIAYEIRYKRPYEDVRGHSWEDNQGEHFHSYENTDEVIDVHAVSDVS